MGKFKDVSGRLELSIFLLCLSFILFSWHFFVSSMEPKTIFYFLFISWGIIIVCLFMIHRRGEEEASDKESIENEVNNV